MVYNSKLQVFKVHSSNNVYVNEVELIINLKIQIKNIVIIFFNKKILNSFKLDFYFTKWTFFFFCKNTFYNSKYKDYKKVNMILSKKKKIILSLLGLGALTIIPILVTNTNKKNISRKINFSSTATLKGSKITNGNKGKFFQDEFKNLWAFGFNSRLEVLAANENGNGYVNTGWTNDFNSGLTKNSNILNSNNGTIFQDSFKNLWTMGKGSKLQVLKANLSGNGYVEEGWINNTPSGDSLLKNSNITNGEGGTIFQDSFKNLWAMGYGSSLQVLKANPEKVGYVKDGWTNDLKLGLTKNSNILSGTHGKIFQDKFKNLWTMGNVSKLQVLKANLSGNGYVEEGWINNNSSSGDTLLKNSNITNGWTGTIFQDEFKNLWSMGYYSKPQVLKVNQNSSGYVEEGWINDNSQNGDNLLKNSNVYNGWDATIFQDEFKNLWSMGNLSKLQFLRVNQNSDGYANIGWIKDNSSSGDILLKNSNITNGLNGTIFQDKFKNLWAMSSGSKLQVFKANKAGNGYVEEGWINDNSQNEDNLLQNSNINNGEGGTIFQDSFKNLWSMGKNSKLQVLKVNEDGDGYVKSWESL